MTSGAAMARKGVAGSGPTEGSHKPAGNSDFLMPSWARGPLRERRMTPSPAARGDADHPQPARGDAGVAQQVARARALREELAIVAARAGEQRFSSEHGVAVDRGLEVGARAVAQAGNGRGPAEHAVHGPGVAGELHCMRRSAWGSSSAYRRAHVSASPNCAAASASEPIEVSQSIVLGIPGSPPTSTLS
jgi:hypothetical protein